MAGEQQKIVLDQDFIHQAILDRVFRLGLWQSGLSAHVNMIANMDLKRLPPKEQEAVANVLYAIGAHRFPIVFHAEVVPMYSAAEVMADAMDRR